MVQDDQSSKEPSSKKKVSTKEKEKLKSKEKPPTKVIVRRLPPSMTEDTFLDQISPLPDNDYFYYVKGDHHIGVPTFSRAYINFINQEDIFHFQEKFDGYVFLDQTGNEYPAVVEFAPFQKVPKSHDAGGKEDKCNTLDNDSHYLDFLKKLENPEEVVLPSAETYLEQLEQREREMKANGASKIVTPLVEFIHQRRLDREKYREEKKEERRRKELEKKKLRDVERTKKREAKKDEKKQEKLQANKSKKEEEKPATPIKVLKNMEREQMEKAEKNQSSPAQTSKKLKDASKPKSEKPKEKTAKDKKLRSAAGTSQTDKKASSEASENVKTETQSTFKATTAKNEEKFSNQETNCEQSADIGKDDAKQDSKKTETEGEKERKIRNKDRPAIQIYRPGAKRLSAQKEDTIQSSATTPATSVKREVKSRTFSRSTNKDSA